MEDQSEGVFVCHSSADAIPANRLVRALERIGVTCWIAPRDVTSGLTYARQLVRAIADCGVFLMLVTEHSAASEHVIREVEQAAKHHRPILPVVVAGAMSEDLDYYLSTIHQIHGATFDEAIALTREYFELPDDNRPTRRSNSLGTPAEPPTHPEACPAALKVGVIPWPPFAAHAVAPAGPQGLFIDLLQRYGEANHIAVEFRDITNEQSTRLLDDGTLDVVACLYRTPRRDRAYDFAACRYAATIGAVVRESEDRINSIGDLMRDEIKIVACTGEIGAEIAVDQLGARPGTARLMEMDTVNVRHIGLMVAAGAADAAITDSITCQLILDEIGPTLKQAFPMFPLYVGQIGLLMSEGRVELQQHLTNELRELAKDPDFLDREKDVLAPYQGMLQVL